MIWLKTREFSVLEQSLDHNYSLVFGSNTFQPYLFLTNISWIQDNGLPFPQSAETSLLLLFHRWCHWDLKVCIDHSEDHSISQAYVHCVSRKTYLFWKRMCFLVQVMICLCFRRMTMDLKLSFMSSCTWSQCQSMAMGSIFNIELL